MRNELLKELQLEDLSGSARELAELVGMEAFLNLVDVYGGSSNLYVPTAKQLILKAVKAASGWLRYVYAGNM